MFAKSKTKAPVMQNVERWGCYEVAFMADVPAGRNPFDVQLTATFCSSADTMTVAGF